MAIKKRLVIELPIVGDGALKCETGKTLVDKEEAYVKQCFGGPEMDATIVVSEQAVRHFIASAGAPEGMWDASLVLFAQLLKAQEDMVKLNKEASNGKG